MPTTRPAASIAASAVACVRPTTFGTPTGCTPSDTTRFTAVPGSAVVPPAGFWLITLPAGTVASYAVVTVPTTRPAASIAASAVACVRPTTFGTPTGCTPSDTTRSTAVPGSAFVPPAGFWLITLPAGTVASYAVVTVPTTRPAAAIAASAFACVRPTTFGTPTGCTPSDTTRSTAVPGSAFVPPAGFWLITLPAGTVASYAVVTVPNTRPAASIAASAFACVRPTTFGTPTGCGSSNAQAVLLGDIATNRRLLGCRERPVVDKDLGDIALEESITAKPALADQVVESIGQRRHGNATATEHGSILGELRRAGPIGHARSLQHGHQCRFVGHQTARRIEEANRTGIAEREVLVARVRTCATEPDVLLPRPVAEQQNLEPALQARSDASPRTGKRPP